jgi:pimeloyl-ACP methyl ester carboxylesterase
MSEQMVARVADLDGMRLHCREAGVGPTVVLLHGAGGAPHDAAFIPALATRFRLLVPSLPGCDESDPGPSDGPRLGAARGTSSRL